MSTVRITAMERIGRTPATPAMTAELEREAVLDRGLETVQSREVKNVRLTFGFNEKAHVVEFHPRHLDAVLDLLGDVRRRLNDVPTLDEERLS